MKTGFFAEKEDGTHEYLDMDDLTRVLPNGVTLNLDPLKAVRCAAACESKAGFAACVARCMATGEVCDGGTDDCRPL